MPRLRRVILPGEPHHVTQRGNRRTDIYCDNEDREVYLFLLKKYSSVNSIEIFSYCLMTNHYHLLVTPRRNMTGHRVWTGFYFCGISVMAT